MPRKKSITTKKHKGFYIYSRDLLSSQRYRRCSWATKGVYLDLLNVLAVQDHPGALCLRDFDLKPRGERSLTQRCLACQAKAKAGEYQSLKYFAEAISVSVSGPRPGLIHGLQELYMRGIISISGDVLYQPRMYRDSGIEVTDFYGEPIVLSTGETLAADGDEKGDNIGTENSTEKGTKNPRVGAGDAPARSKRVGVRVNNKVVDSSSSSGSSKVTNKAKAEKTTIKKMTPVADCPPSLDDVIFYFAERRQQEKPLEYISPEEFYAMCETSGWTRGKNGQPIYNWKSYALQCDIWRQNHGDLTTAQRTAKNAPTGRRKGSVAAQNNAADEPDW